MEFFFGRNSVHQLQSFQQVYVVSSFAISSTRHPQRFCSNMFLHHMDFSSIRIDAGVFWVPTFSLKPQGDAGDQHRRWSHHEGFSGHDERRLTVTLEVKDGDGIFVVGACGSFGTPILLEKFGKKQWTLERLWKNLLRLQVDIKVSTLSFIFIGNSRKSCFSSWPFVNLDLKRLGVSPNFPQKLHQGLHMLTFGPWPAQST